MIDILELATLNAERTADPFYAGYTVYDIQPSVVYPAIIAWIVDNRAALEAAILSSDGALIDRAVGGDTLAQFVVTARQLANEALAVPVMGWQLALVKRDAVAEGDVPLRARALHTAYRIYTNRLHAAIEKPLSVHILEEPDWRQ